MDDTSVTIGLLLALFVYYLFVFFGRRRDMSHLAYSLLCLAYAFMTFVTTYYPQSAFFNEEHYKIIFLCVISLIGLSLVFFSHSVFDLGQLKPYSQVSFAVFIISGLILGTLYLQTKETIFLTVTYFILLFCALSFFSGTAFILIIQKQYRDRKKRMFMAGYLVLLIQVVIFLIVRIIFSYSVPSPYLRLAILLMIFLFAYTLTDSFNREYKDLRELKDDLENKIQERTLQLKKTHKQKTNFFINLAYETRTPLTLISNYLDTYIKKKNNTETKKIKHNIEKLLNDIMNILDMQKLEEGITVYNHNQTLNLTHIIQQKILVFKELADKKDITFHTKFEKDIFIRIDPYAIDRILNNLFDNAVKYNHRAGSIKVKLKTRLLENKAEISIKDTGIGIHRQKLAHIFDPFYQISPEKKNYHGLGLGLSIVKSIADDIGAVLSVKSVPGKGTEFTIAFKKYMPAKNELVLTYTQLSKPIDTVADAEFKPGKHDNNRYNVFVVEDSLEMLCFLKEHIGRRYNFHSAEDGNSALQILETVPRPDIIISDIMMKGIDGYEFFKRISEHRLYKSIPFIFLTAKTSTHQKLKGLNRGALDYITKPFSIDVLMAKIASIIKNQEKQKEAVLDGIGRGLHESMDSRIPSGSTGTGTPVVLKEGGRRTVKSRQKRIKSVSHILKQMETDYGISKKEMEVIRLIKEGRLYKEIADELNVSINTVETYRKRIFRKCNIQSKVELFRLLNEK